MSIFTTAEKITNLFLYGEENNPADMTDENIIRPKNAISVEITIDGNDFMANGPGRFILPALFDIVKEFFTIPDLAPSGNNGYTEKEIREKTGVTKGSQVFYQHNFDDGLDNYAERAYIWESGEFEIEDGVRFFVTENGTRYIENLKVIPYANPNDPKGSHGGVLDNFDYSGGSIFDGPVGVLSKIIDPSGIGQTVNLEITNVTNSIARYEFRDFVNDLMKANSFYVSTLDAAVKLVSAGFDLMDQLFDSGSIRFLDDDNKPILYGSDQGDIIQGTVSRTGVDIADIDHPLSGWTENGINYIGGAGDDTLEGTDHDDKLFGGDDNDILIGLGGDDALEGEKGNDRLFGEDGNDTYIYKQGDGFDTIIDTDGEGSIIEDNITLTGGKQLGDNRVYQGIDANNTKHTYVFVTGDNGTGGDLLVDGVILIKNFNNGGLGLNFTNADPEQTPQTSRTINGDLNPVDSDITQDGIQMIYDDLNNVVVTDEAAAGREDTLNDSAGNDAINSGAGNDVINAFRGGDDLIDAGAGQDQVYESNAVAGNDVISGGADNDILAGGQGNDRIYADQPISVADAIANGNSQDGTGNKGDWLSGQAGDDTQAGGADNDVLSGGGGGDLLIGGAGDDDILGDKDVIAQGFNWTVTWIGNARHFEPLSYDDIPADGGGGYSLRG